VRKASDMTYRFGLRPSRLAATGLSAVALITGALAGAAVAVALPAQAQSLAGSRHTPRGWRVVKLIGTKDVFPNALAAVSASDAWLGGSRSSLGTPVLYRLSRGKLRTVVPPGGNGAFVSDLGALSASDVWATESNAPYVLHLGRHGWSKHSLAIGSDDILLDGVVPVSAKSTWVFDEDWTAKTYYSYHYNGKTWAQRTLPDAIDGDTNTELVSGTSDGNIWALSFTGPGGTPNAVHYNGKKWLLTKFPSGLAPAGYTLYSSGIYAQSPTSVWAPLYSLGKTGYGPLVLLHWNGTRWSKIGGKLPKAALLGPITSDGHGGLWLYARTRSGLGGLFLHYSGGRWTTYKEPTALASHQLVDVTGLALLPGSSAVLAAGSIGLTMGGDSGGAVLEYTP
jgi:hypothetical protein